jgi:hypothetical protein
MVRTVLLAITIVTSLAANTPAQTQNAESLARQARYIFRGKVEKLRASNLKALPATDKTAVVLVREVLSAPPTLNNFTGQRITVQLAKADSPRAGQEAIFFTNGWLYGETLAVIEVAHLSPRLKTDDVRKQIGGVRDRMNDEKLSSRIDKAELVIVGRVTSAQPLDSVDTQREGPRRSEHYPEWWQATIEVESFDKGQSPTREVVILFPNSMDEMWLLSPKFKPGDSGVWILQRNQTERGFPIFRKPGLTALDVLDFRPLAERDRVRRLIKR